MTMPAGWAELTPEQRAARRTERRAKRTTRRTERRARVDQAIAQGRAGADQLRAGLQGRFDQAIAGQGPMADLIRELAPLIRTGLTQLKPGGETFDANPFFESFYAKVPAQYQTQVRAAVGDLPTRINTIAGSLENRAQIQPMPQPPTPGGPMNPPGSTPAGGTADLAALIRQYMSQKGTPGAGTPGVPAMPKWPAWR